MDDESDSWFPDLLCALIGIVLGALAHNTIVHSLAIGGAACIFIGVPCGLVSVGMHFRPHCLGRLLQIAAAAVVTVIVMAGK